MNFAKCLILATLCAVFPALAVADSRGAKASSDNDDVMLQSELGALDVDPARGRVLFAEKGCVLCHSVNGIGGEDAAPLDTSEMEHGMNPYDMAAKMWEMAPYMIEAQEEEMGGQILFSGAELGNIIAFLHDDAEQQKFTKESLPENISEMLEHGHHHDGDEHHHD